MVLSDGGGWNGEAAAGCPAVVVVGAAGGGVVVGGAGGGGDGVVVLAGAAGAVRRAGRGFGASTVTCIASLARPGGNVTGFVFQQLELAQKQVELLNQAFPDRTRLAMLFDAQSSHLFVAAARTAKLLHLHVQSLLL